MKRSYRTMLALGAALFAPTALQAETRPTIRTTEGRVVGKVSGGVESWKGIPFAAAPVGPLRWRAPQPVTPRSTTLDAANFKNDCMQRPVPIPAFNSSAPVSEDCLYLNVWRPARGKAKMPVLVWIYGGGWVIGGTSVPIYSGESLARKGVVAVNLNYRLGQFGFFAHPQLTRANADGGLFFNYGILDQIAALKWIKRNIAAFGGDPDNITLIGESAGGVSIHVLVTSPLVEKGLFHKAIVMSGADGGNLGTGGLSDAEDLGVNFAQTLGIAPDDPRALEKLRALSADRIQGDRTFGTPPSNPPVFNGGGPIEEGKIVAKVGAAYESGQFQHIPMMIGATNGDLGGRTGFMINGARQVSLKLAKAGVPVYQYRFSYLPDRAPPIGIPSTTPGGAPHALDIPFFLGTVGSMFGAQLAARDQALANKIGSYVISFAKSDPKRPMAGDWPRFVAPSDPIVTFAATGRAVIGPDPWAAELDAAPAPTYPGISAGGAKRK